MTPLQPTLPLQTPLQPTLHPPTTNTIHDSTIPTPLLTPLPTHFDSQYASPSLPTNEPEPSISISMKLHQSLILFSPTLFTTSLVRPDSVHSMCTHAKSEIVKPRLNPILLLTHLEPKTT